MPNIPDADVRWQFEIEGGIESSPTVINGTLYVGTTDSNVYALDTATGEEQWTFQTGDEVTAAPAVAGETVVISSTDGNLYGVSIDDGTEQWCFEAGIEIGSSPTVVEGTAYVGSSGFTDTGVYAVDIENGTERWFFETEQRVGTSATVIDTRNDESRANRTVLVASGTHDGIVHALDGGDGTELWRFQPSAMVSAPVTVPVSEPSNQDKNDQTDAPTVQPGWAAYAGSGTLHGTVTTLGGTTGEAGWSIDTLGKLRVAPTVADGTVFFGCTRGDLYAVDALTGETRWKRDLTAGKGYAVWADPTVIGDTVVTGTSGGQIVGADISDGAIRWSFPTHGIPSTPIVVGGTAFFGTEESDDGDGGVLYAIDVPDETGESCGSRVCRGTLGHHENTVHQRTKPESSDSCLNCDKDLAHLDAPSYCPNCGWEITN
ncbi:PQQ-binding-like beta-propeller repeat protein [Halogeometricum borinquense]|uniref:PQQ-binding-like beta-propeller repeat protein n=1 Tax=Halogeometricum borinquense TaxID=60847 RepID=A0A6C0UKE5_9EURY|nr:PQQ-binding-like beta-propeller repeat protein [Halogeometricum borinquense]QIB75982.1 PQQ-binding-like beta-propeller repeat protein [Halogeometricum borinquense]